MLNSVLCDVSVAERDVRTWEDDTRTLDINEYLLNKMSKIEEILI